MDVPGPIKKVGRVNLMQTGPSPQTSLPVQIRLPAFPQCSPIEQHLPASQLCPSPVQPCPTGTKQIQTNQLYSLPRQPYPRPIEPCSLIRKACPSALQSSLFRQPLSPPNRISFSTIHQSPQPIQPCTLPRQLSPKPIQPHPPLIQGGDLPRRPCPSYHIQPYPLTKESFPSPRPSWSQTIQPSYPSILSSSTLPKPPTSQTNETHPPSIQKPTVGRRNFEIKCNNNPTVTTKTHIEKLSKCCSQNCREVLSSWAEEDKEKLKSEFGAVSIVDRKNKLLQHLKTQTNLGLTADNIIWNKHSFCSKSFGEAVNMSQYIIHEVGKANSLGTKKFVHGNNAMAKMSLPTIKFKVWMRSFIDRYGQSAPDDNVQVLNHWLTKHEMYKIYLKESSPPFLALKTFYQDMKIHFGPYRVDKSDPQVRISKYSSHSVCDQCVAFDSSRRTCKTEDDLKRVNYMKAVHMQKVSGAKNAMEEIIQRALQFPEDVLIVQLDGMDNSKSYCPHLKDKTKKTAGLLRLPTKIIGCILYSGLYPQKRKVTFYVEHDHYEQGSNLVVSVIFKQLLVFIEDHGRLPKTLQIFADNCWRENKNQFVFAFLSQLLNLGIFSEANMNFLIVGHTGNEVDQLFSILTPEFKSQILTVDSLKEKIRNAPIKPKPVVETLFYTWDWKSFIEKYLLPLKYHTTYNSFSFRKEDGEVKFRCKRLPQDPEYGPSGGIKLLKDGIILQEIGVAGFRIESLNLDKLMRHLETLFHTLALTNRLEMMSSWTALKKTLEALPSRKSIMPKMDLKLLTKASTRRPIPVAQEEVQNLPEIQGQFFEETVELGEIGADIAVNVDVCVYTNCKNKRPWVGRVKEIKANSFFTIHWFEKIPGSKCGEYRAMFLSDGSPYISDQSMDTIMFWEFTHSRDENLFKIDSYWLTTLINEYKKLDG